MAESTQNLAPPCRKRGMTNGTPAHWMALAMLAAVGLLAYGNGWDAPLVFDSVYLIRFNPALRPEATWSEFLAAAGSRPMGYATFALNYRFHHDSVWGYHLVNRLIHFAAGLVLFLLLEHTFRRRRWPIVLRSQATLLAATATALWLVHPLNTQSVTYVAQRFESLCGLLYLATLYAAARSFDIRGADQHGCRLGWQAAAVLACQLAMLTKEVAVTAPLLVAIYDWQLAARSLPAMWQRRRWFYLALAATAIPLALLHAWQPERLQQEGIGQVAELTSMQYAASQPAVIVHYLRLAATAGPLCFDYGWPPVESWRQAAAPLVLLLLMLAAAGLRGGGWVVAAVLLPLLPSSSVVPIRDLCVEHRMYLSLAALVALLVALTWIALMRCCSTRAARRWGRRGFTVVMVCLVLCLAWLTAHRNETYRSPVELWADAAARSPANPRAHYHAGLYHWEAGNAEAAARALATALTFAPGTPSGPPPQELTLSQRRFLAGLLPDATWNRAARRYALLLLDAQDFATADGWLHWLSQRDPLGPADLLAWGRCRAALGDDPAAIEHLQAALLQAPHDTAIHLQLAEALERQGQHEAAARHRAAADAVP